MLTRRNALLIPGVLALAGCQPPSLDVHLSGSLTDLKFSVSRRTGPLGLLPEFVPIVELTVEHWEPSARGDMAWEISGATCGNDVKRVQYGAAPASFVQVAPARPLRSSQIYLVRIDGCSASNSEGIEFFKFTNNRVRRVSNEDLDRVSNGAS